MEAGSQINADRRRKLLVKDLDLAKKFLGGLSISSGQVVTVPNIAFALDG